MTITPAQATALAASVAAFPSDQTTSSACSTTSCVFFSASRPARPTQTYFRNFRAGTRASNCDQESVLRVSMSWGRFPTHHLVNFFESAVFDFWQEEEDPNPGGVVCQSSRGTDLVIKAKEYLRAKPAWTNPDVSVLWPPIKRLRVDKVRSSESSKPSCEEADRGRQAESV